MQSDLVPLLAPLGAFLVVLLFGSGLYRTANHGGLLARKRLAAFAPAPAVAPAPLLATTPLLRQARFSSIALLDRLLLRNGLGDRLSLGLARAALPLRVGEYLLIRCLLGFALLTLGWVGAHSAILSIVGAAAGFFAPVLYVRWRQAQRTRQFDDQLVDGLTLISNALKSGYSFLQGMEAVAKEMPDPVGTEFGQALRHIRVGGAVEEALTGIGHRVRSADFDLVVTAMVIQRQVGGNMTEILSNIAWTVRERHRILREIRVLTAQERLSGYVIAALPLFLIVVLTIMNPSYLNGLWGHQSGKLMLAGGLVMDLFGLLVIHKIVEIEV